jgi:hypothetical protein
MSHHHEPNHPYCKNCYYPIASLDKFCPKCGQKPTTGRVTLHDLIHELVHTTLHLDGKFFSTLKDLFTPGKLTKEFFLGHHPRYAHPIPMVLVLAGFFFLMVGLVTHKAEDGLHKQVRKSQKKYNRQEFILDLDSIKRVVATRTTSMAGKKALDSLIAQYKNEDTKGNTNADTVGNHKKKNGAGNQIEEEKDEDDEVENQQAGKDAKLKKKLDTSESKKSAKDNYTIAPRDSIQISNGSIFGMKFPLIVSIKDYNSLSSDQIVENYHIKGFWRQLVIGQMVKFKQNGGSFLHHYIKKISAMMLLMLPAIAFILRLLYRKKWYYVEHLIFMIHYHCSWFLIGGIALALDYFAPHSHTWGLISGFGTGIVFLFGLPLFLYLAMKRYYQQGWGKTFVKHFILAMGYFICTLIFVGLTTVYAAVTY